MPKIYIDKSILIKAKPSDIYSKLMDFNHWIPWSPWLVTEPEAKVKIAEDGRYYEWEGKLTGMGNMTVLTSKENERINYDLTFLKPFKSKATVAFILKKEGENTRVHWTMDSKLPFLMFWMKKMMIAFVGMDYTKGLNMLKDYVEDGKVHSKLEFNGVNNYQGCQYIGFTTKCSLDNIGEKMKNDFERLMPFMMEKHKEKIAGNAFSIYHKWNPVKNSVEYTAAIPVSAFPNNMLPDMISGNIMPSKVHSIKHTGPHRHIGNAWSAQYARSRAKVFKTNKKNHPMEVYLNSPKETPEKELQSEILFAVL